MKIILAVLLAARASGAFLPAKPAVAVAALAFTKTLAEETRDVAGAPPKPCDEFLEITELDDCNQDAWDPALVAKCAKCVSDREDAELDRKMAKENVVTEQRARSNKERCQKSATTKFKHFKGPHKYEEKAKWEEKCIQEHGGLVDPSKLAAYFTSWSWSSAPTETTNTNKIVAATTKLDGFSKSSSKSSEAWSKFVQKMACALGAALFFALLAGAAYNLRQQMAPGPGGPTPATPHPIQSGLLWLTIICGLVALFFLGVAIHKLLFFINNEL
jgi:hypothetical protein